MDSGERKKPTLVRDDFLQAMHEFLPVAMRDITKASSDDGRRGWEDVGGLIDIRNAIKEVHTLCVNHTFLVIQPFKILGSIKLVAI